MKASLKELRLVHRVLTTLDYPVPTDLMLYLSNQISEKEDKVKMRIMERMSEEELIALDDKQSHHLRVHLNDGRFIQMKKNKSTFEQAIREIDFDKVSNYDITLGTKPLFYLDHSKKQRRVKKYLFVRPGLFVLTGISANRMKEILEKLDEILELGWDIELI